MLGSGLHTPNRTPFNPSTVPHTGDRASFLDNSMSHAFSDDSVDAGVETSTLQYDDTDENKVTTGPIRKVSSNSYSEEVITS